MTFLIYFLVSAVFYLAFLFVEVTYLDLLEARIDSNLSCEACMTILAAIFWPLVLAAVVLALPFGLTYRVVMLFNSPKIGWCHRQLGLLVSRCSQETFSFLRAVKRKFKELRDVAASEGTEEAPGQNQEGIEANFGGSAQI